jgi:hypothetical protein
LRAESGSLLVRGCDFQEDKPQVFLGERVRRAIISDNLTRNKLRVVSQSKGEVRIHGNTGQESETLLDAPAERFDQ